MFRIYTVLTVCAVSITALLVPASLQAVPFSLNLPAGVDPASIRVTTFATGQNFPTGMIQLADGSLLVGESNTTSAGQTFYSTSNTGSLVRFVDANHDGVADGPGVNIAPAGFTGQITSLAQAGNLLFVNHATGGSPSISVLRAGATPSSPYTNVGSINLNYVNPNAEHQTYELETRPTPGQPGSYDLFFNIGSEFNDTNSTTPVNLGGLTSATGLLPESIYKLTVTDNGSSVAMGAPLQIASGLRNAAGIAVHPTTGDLWFEDNGIDGPTNDQYGNIAFSADELNKIAAGQIGGAVENFGFSNSYVRTSDGAIIGPPTHVAAFLPVGGNESEGANQIAIAPAAFPAGLNNGVFVGFHGQFSAGGTANDENALAYYDIGTGVITHIVPSLQAGVGHLDGLLSTSDSLFVADLATNGNLFGVPQGPGSGAIYQFWVVPEPSTLVLGAIGLFALAALARRRKMS